jgi:hypothetical protein
MYVIMKGSCSMTKRIGVALSILIALTQNRVIAQDIDFGKERKAVVEHWRFVGNHREESM